MRIRPAGCQDQGNHRRHSTAGSASRYQVMTAQTFLQQPKGNGEREKDSVARLCRTRKNLEILELERILMWPNPDDKNAKAPSLRAYQKPALNKGPVLTSITATLIVVSGAIPSDNNLCWVARAAFGETDIRWMIFREWLVVEAPAWFRKLYVRHGEAVGCWLKGHQELQGAVRCLMIPAVNRVLRK